MTDAVIGLPSNSITFSACDVIRKTYWLWGHCWRVCQQLVISCIVEKVQLIAGRLHSETRLPIVWLEDPRKLSKKLIVTKYSLSKFQGKFPSITEDPLGNYSSWATSSSPGQNQIWICDDVTHICKMAPTPRNTREGHFLALCCA